MHWHPARAGYRNTSARAVQKSFPRNHGNTDNGCGLDVAAADIEISSRQTRRSGAATDDALERQARGMGQQAMDRRLDDSAGRRDTRPLQP